MATIIRMPEVLANATEATIASWEVAEGAKVNVGDVLAELETDKALVEYAAEESGVLGSLLAQTGEKVAVGAPIAVLLAQSDEDVDLDALLGGEATITPVTTPSSTAPATLGAPESSSPPAAATASEPPTPPPGRIFGSPLARKLAKERGIDISQLRGTGPGGRIVRRDIEAYEAAQSKADEPAPAPPVAASEPAADTATFDELPHTGMRRAIARRLTESKSTVPHFYLTANCHVDELLTIRQKLNDAGNTKISVNAFILKAVASAFEVVPEANVVWTDTSLRRYRTVDVAVAVATDNGLVTPVIRRIESASLKGVDRQVADLVERARNGRLRQDELEGGTFAVSNLGMYGTQEFSAILNPPQSGILAVGAALEQPVAVAGELAVATVMRCTLSADHRAVDGALAAQWLRAFQHLIENPLLTLA